MVNCTLMGRNTLIINDEKIAHALLDQRSHNYSEKHDVEPIAVLGLDFNTAFMPYTDNWRMHRRFYHQAMRADVVGKYEPVQLRAAHKLLGHLLAEPEHFEAHFQTHSAAIILAVVYGYDMMSRKDHLVHVIENATEAIVNNGSPLVMAIVATCPFLLKMPSWIPDRGFRKMVEFTRKSTQAAVELPYKWTQDQLAEGSAGASMIRDVFENSEEKGMSKEFEHNLKNASATAFSAGSDTSFSTLQVFLWLMVMYPDVQKRAQAEMDAVVGTDRLPDFSDRESLPYLEAILRETMRWCPVVTTSLPHGSIEDDTYEGYFIPAGTNVIANTRGILHDEARYPEPNVFRPERFLLPNGKPNDDTTYLLGFGYGRRICPGRHLADGSVWSAMACLIAMFNFAKAKNATGEEIEVHPTRWTGGITTRPVDFQCSISPRFPGASEKLARATDASA
ncbi:cytochrome P450 [Coniophora puteana RWD-64-598 SS2]|uniref:Cytochrome P450 n=1 Tax=Coniophora puteana (strain RWD-64-598) TaxID=741705 RepID=A0A5M3MYS8_CONPW|nr:cytochrome P450 [Coniophora puteana RWD-64-598 SS2]EIW84290.1 cytochrome P450 [Coniophora puteana RWD-64-598 SS2]